MEQIKQKIDIVDYHGGLAAGVAEMWNLSREGWGGDSHVTTEEKVRTQEANSSNLNLYLAMDGEKVVGYCGLSEYREDEGALYIPLLNVRTDYHGRKIGKQLVLKALERAVELGWPRLDLYTWPGNTKAVPLYKRCGFFWEDRDDVTHLMNFMPTVLNTEAVQDFFQDVNWYEASTRVIEVSPDGRKDSDFSYYEYKWKEKEHFLRMEFERTGRGLRLIETNDYLISAEVENFKLVCDSSYKVRYYVKNKTGIPLHIDFEGENHKLIDLPFMQSVDVKGETVVETTFTLKGLEEEQSNWRTHPSVKTNLIINGKRATFAVGILPKLPAKISGVVPGSQCYLEEEATFYLDVENNYQVGAIFSFDLPEDRLLTLNKQNYEVTVPPKGKVSIPINYKLNRFGFYSPLISVGVVKETGESHHFKKQIGIGFKGIGAKFSGECDDYWHIYNGLYHMYLRKFDNEIIPGRLTKGTQKTIGLFPKIGKPYSNEFSKRKPKSVHYEQQKGAIVLFATYESTDFPETELVNVSKLYAEGLIEQSYIIRNHNDCETENPVWVYQPIYHVLNKPVFAMNHQVVEVNEQANAEYGLWDSKKLTENWLFSRHTPYAHGICWPEDAKVNFESWYMYVEHELGIIPAHSELETKPVYLSFGAYQSWEEFRDFAKKRKMEKVTTVDDVTISGVHVKENKVEINLQNQKEGFFQGSVQFSHGANHIMTNTYSLQDEKRSVLVSTQFNKNTLSSVEARYELNGIEAFKKALVFKPCSEGISIQKKYRDGHEVMIAQNGKLSISAAASFFPALYSLKAFGKEWLDSSFPKLQPKSWWNPWSGGIRSSFQGINHKSFVKERTTVSEGSLFDQFGLEWKGLKISTVFNENESFKGLGIEQYYVMLPGVPVLAYATKFIQTTGSYIHYKKWYSECCFMPGNTLEQGWLKSNHQQEKYFAGKTEFMTNLHDHILIGSTIDKHILQVITDRDAVEIESYVNKEIQSLAIWRELHLASGAEWLSSPSFFIAHDSILSKDEVKQLKGMQLKEGLHENH
jgi:ribosomal protein S18 acetylase RimI-like enzyme